MVMEIGLSNMLNTIYIVLYALIGAIAAMIYGLKKVYKLERRLIDLDKKVVRILNKISKQEVQELKLLKRKKR